ncbi:hypothetical protein FA13DRAFT_1790950 [Coprinellus micaceus]|uniref:Uncharacterized protein n=1 Tax=Coprinellus micaceus TaxID=71717 RepID=A0A4Y7TDN3_COPMI|nr:hypothetical protein FA13DRAFT_1790950 [Coprinellus micaceus]
MSIKAATTLVVDSNDFLHSDEIPTGRGKKRYKESPIELALDSQAADTVEALPMEMSPEKEGSSSSGEDWFETPPSLNEVADASTTEDTHPSEKAPQAESESGYTSDDSTANLNDNPGAVEDQLHSMICDRIICFPFTIILGLPRGERNSRETGSVDEKSDEGSISGS